MKWTPSQLEAITAAGSNVLVSAAAGSGKTAVLAERCVRLIAEGRPRCSIEQVLVVTFNQAAAQQMKHRIAETLAERLRQRPRDRHLRQQWALLPAANVQTLHSFCLEVVQTCASRQADRTGEAAPGQSTDLQLLDPDEVQLLKDQVLSELFADLYAGRTADGEDPSLPAAFRRLVDDYGLGEDERLGELVRSISDFLASLPRPQDWLAEARRQAAIAEHPDELQRRMTEVLIGELGRQQRALENDLSTLRTLGPQAEAAAKVVEDYRQALHTWQQMLAEGPGGLSAVCDATQAFQFQRRGRTPRPASSAEHKCRKLADKTLERVRDRYFRRRVQERLGLLRLDEQVQSLGSVRDYTETLLSLVETFGPRFQKLKQEQGGMDFADLERQTLELLCYDGRDDQPSELAEHFRQRFVHVLVDEFQDINPTQGSILRLLSRPAQRGGNLFCVGDVKQSIYRFRLAEPTIFLRQQQAWQSSDAGRVIPLQENFRSRSAVLQGINAIFQKLLTADNAGIDYDQQAFLQPGRAYPAGGAEANFAELGIDVHLISPADSARLNEDQANDDELLEGIEREALLAGRLIRQWLDQPVRVYEPPAPRKDHWQGRPIEPRDIVVLLRAGRNKIAAFARILGEMGVPVREDNPGGWLAGGQVRDVLSLLQVLDNARQDIPLAAVLLGPLCPGGPLTAEDLVRIRLGDRSVSFHQAVQVLADGREPAALRARLRMILAKLEEWRQALNHQNLAEAIWMIYEQTHLLARAAALPDGQRRRADLLELHERARIFTRRTRPTLGRFVNFLNELQERAAESRGAGLVPAENAVHVTTIHQAKGLEFGAVIVPDLGKRFNLEDARGMVTFERSAYVGVRAVEPTTRRAWPTFASEQTAAASLQETLAEELRILYVAMTRAKERVVLIGQASEEQVELARARWADHDQALGALEFCGASRAMDWLLASLAMQPREVVGWGADAGGGQPIRVTCHRSDEFVAARAPQVAQPPPAEPPPAPEPTDDDPASRVIQRLEFRYPHGALAEVYAARAASELKTMLGDEESGTLVRWPAPGAAHWRRPQWAGPAKSGVSPEFRGQVVHALLEQIDLQRACDAADVRAQYQELVAARRLPAGVLGEDDLAALVWWFGTKLGRSQRSCGDQVRREVPFILAWQPEVVLADSRRDDAEDFTLVRGVIDAMWPAADGSGWVLVDYKTDAVTGAALAERSAFYQPQLAIYSSAIERIWQVRVAQRWLVFLSARQLVPLDGQPGA